MNEHGRTVAVEHHGRVTRRMVPASTRRRLSGDVDANLSLRGDGGYAMALTALLIIPIMIFLSLAIDLGAWYAQGSKQQRASDAAAMAGVVWLPDQAKASAAALDVAKANGYSTGVTPAVPAGTSNQYMVTIASQAPRFFSTVFQSWNFNITRTATAAYNKKIPMGSPTNQFGNDAATCPQFQASACATAQPLLWSAINGPQESCANGDPYATTKCSSYRNTGYRFAIDVTQADVGKSLTVQLYDIGTYTRTVGSGAGNDCNTAAAPFLVAPYRVGGAPNPDFNRQHCQTGDSFSSAQMPMDFQVFDNDGVDLTTTEPNFTAFPACHQTYSSAALGTSATYKNKWITLCTFTAAKKGIYPMKVRNSGLGLSESMSGINAYSIKVTGGTTTQLYALDDMSIWTNSPGSTAKFYLAEVKPEHAGKKLRIDLYDPGDGNASASTGFFMQVRAPAGGAPSLVPSGGTVIPAPGVVPVNGCKYSSPGSSTANKTPFTTDSTSSTCSIQTQDAGVSGGGRYNAKWLHVEVQLDSAYTCNTVAIPDCWWTINYSFGTGAAAAFPTDRTVWALDVVGDPVHLVN